MWLNDWYKEYKADLSGQVEKAQLEADARRQSEERKHKMFMQNQDEIQKKSAQDAEETKKLFDDTLWSLFGVKYDKVNFDRLHQDAKDTKRHLECMQNLDEIERISAQDAKDTKQLFDDTLWSVFVVKYDNVNFDLLRKENEGWEKQRELDKAKRVGLATKQELVEPPSHKVIADTEAVANAHNSMDDVTHNLSKLKVDDSKTRDDVSTLEKSGVDQTGDSEKLYLEVNSTRARSSSPRALTCVASLLPLPMRFKYYGYMSHNWGERLVNHKRVKRIVDAFEQNGKKMWYDADRSKVYEESQLTKHIDECATVVVFITAAYMQKIRKKKSKGKKDLCSFDFEYARKHRQHEMIAVVMEQNMSDQSKWEDPLMDMKMQRFIDYTSEDKFESCCNELAGAIAESVRAGEPNLS